jgi:hypothetical protein
MLSEELAMKTIPPFPGFFGSGDVSEDDADARDSSPHALTALRAAHAVIEETFRRYRAMADSECKQLCLMALCEQMTVYLTMSAFYFYPAILEAVDDPECSCNRVILKYMAFTQLIDELADAAPDDVACTEKVKVLYSCFRDHVREEETVTFPMLERSALDLHAIGVMLRVARAGIQREVLAAARDAVPDFDAGVCYSRILH